MCWSSLFIFINSDRKFFLINCVNISDKKGKSKYKVAAKIGRSQKVVISSDDLFIGTFLSLIVTI